MIKSSEFLTEIFFDYLGEEDCAVLASYTDIFPDERLPDGVLWAQYGENEELTALAAVNNMGKSLVFTSEKTDFEELSFITDESIISPDTLPFEQIGEKYLMRCNGTFDSLAEDAPAEKFALIKSLATGNIVSGTQEAAQKIYRKLKNRCHGAEISVNGESVSGGFVTDCFDFAVITDVFTKSEHRGKGYGTEAVKKLLSLTRKKTVYLICKKERIKFYEKIGFSVVKSVYEYKK